VGDEERQASYRALFQSQLEGKLLQAVRYSVNRGMALGSEKFKDEIEVMGGRRQRLLKTGPKPASEEEFLL
jgi:putative transposase